MGKINYNAIKYIGAAILGAATGGPFGTLVAPVALKVSRMRYKDEKINASGQTISKATYRWSQVGLFAGPALWGLAALGGLFAPSEGDLLNQRVGQFIENLPKEVTEDNSAETKKQITELLSKEEICKVDNCYSFSSYSGRILFRAEKSWVVEPHLNKLKAKYDSANELQKRVEEREAAIKRQKAIADGSYLPSLFEVRPSCEKLVEARTLTGRVNWGWFNYDWDRSQKTLVLRGHTKNGFGVELPLVAKCRWEKGNVVRLLSLN